MYCIKVDLKHGLERPVYYAIYKLSLGLYHSTVLGLLDNANMLVGCTDMGACNFSDLPLINITEIMSI